jgi:glycosyltransferase involved in cell wall biosynthesis
VAEVVTQSGGVEILLVDNGSTDTTPKILADFCVRHGARLVSEPRRGKSYGLNRAIEEVRGELIAFVDDDVHLSPGWLLALERAAVEHPNAIVFAGQIRPGWRTTPAGWQVYLTDRGRSHGCTPIEQAAGPIRPNMVKGANMMVRCGALGSVRFDVGGANFDSSSHSAGGEDTAFALALAKNLNECVYVPEALVYHQIDPREMNVVAVFSRCLRIGRVIGRRPGAKRPTMISLGWQCLKLLAALLLLRTSKAAYIMTTIARQLGQRQAVK